MNKMKLIFFFLLIGIPNFAQENLKEQLQNKIEKEVCNCFKSIDNPIVDTLEDCYLSSVTKFESEYDKLVDPNSELSEYEQGEAIGAEIFFNMQRSLIQNCGPYYIFFDKLRSESIVNMRVSYDSKIDSLNNAILQNSTIDALWERGNYYLSNNELEKAKEDYNKCLAQDPNHIQSIFFLGWVNELAGNYEEAISSYTKVLDITGMKEIILFIELARKKSLD